MMELSDDDRLFTVENILKPLDLSVDVYKTVFLYSAVSVGLWSKYANKRRIVCKDVHLVCHSFPYRKR